MTGTIAPISFPATEDHVKAWGSECWVINVPQYCLKVLTFTAGQRFSSHYHLLKTETWYVTKGQLDLEWIDLSNADILTKIIRPGDVIHIPAGNPHRLIARMASEIMEVSTQHFETDSYRISKGASQDHEST